MSTAVIRDAIRDVMLAVPDIGMVHRYERYAKDLSALKALYLSPAHGQLRGWFIRRVKVQETSMTRPRSVELTRWRIQGLMALDDATESELAFDALIEQLRDAFRINGTLNGTVAASGLPDGSETGLQLEDAGPVMFAGVLCHGARLALHTRRLIAPKLT